MRWRVLSCFDVLSMTGIKPFALSLSKGAPPGRPLGATRDQVPVACFCRRLFFERLQSNAWLDFFRINA